ncbi:hypothetical protein LJR029_006701 [Caballeronia sp. LjRoot29]|uniref:hypothetical protein n=1 Tax=Caballeronia sp. LjRoot29 TaxID=3342315 RepID=UPI003ECF177C
MERPSKEDQLFLEARVLALSLVAIRRAQGKLNPNDFQVGSVKWVAVVKEFAEDLMRVSSEALVRVAATTPAKAGKWLG